MSKKKTTKQIPLIWQFIKTLRWDPSEELVLVLKTNFFSPGCAIKSLRLLIRTFESTQNKEQGALRVFNSLLKQHSSRFVEDLSQKTDDTFVTKMVFSPISIKQEDNDVFTC